MAFGQKAARDVKAYESGSARHQYRLIRHPASDSLDPVKKL